jgi:hypothetical protein
MAGRVGGGHCVKLWARRAAKGRQARSERRLDGTATIKLTNENWTMIEKE